MTKLLSQEQVNQYHNSWFVRPVDVLTQDEINKITQELSKSFKSEIKLNYTHDQSLIGGLVVQIGSTMIDTSIKKKLQQLETRMIEA